MVSEKLTVKASIDTITMGEEVYAAIVPEKYNKESSKNLKIFCIFWNNG